MRFRYPPPTPIDANIFASWLFSDHFRPCCFHAFAIDRRQGHSDITIEARHQLSFRQLSPLLALFSPGRLHTPDYFQDSCSISRHFLSILSTTRRTCRNHRRRAAVRCSAAAAKSTGTSAALPSSPDRHPHPRPGQNSAASRHRRPRREYSVDHFLLRVAAEAGLQQAQRMPRPAEPKRCRTPPRPAAQCAQSGCRDVVFQQPNEILIASTSRPPPEAGRWSTQRRLPASTGRYRRRAEGGISRTREITASPFCL